MESGKKIKKTGDRRNKKVRNPLAKDQDILKIKIF
jgi:hypothetical protein